MVVQFIYQKICKFNILELNFENIGTNLWHDFKMMFII